MNRDSNPYAPPGLPEAKPRTWWEWLRRLFQPPLVVSPLEAFLLGQRRIFHGVVFSVNPEAPTTLLAQLPLGVTDEEHVRANVAEAQRVLGEYLQSWPQLKPALVGRTLVVSLTNSYENDASEIARVSVPAEEWEKAVRSAADAE